MTRHQTGRAGFTLLELLAVLAIIGLLSAITAGAVSRYRLSSMEKNTDVHLRKLHILLDQQWKAAIDTIKKEEPPRAIVDLTRNPNGTNDIARARALHMRLRLRQEFPQNFGEVQSTFTATASDGSTYSYSPKTIYTSQMAGAALIDINDNQSAAMLYMILKQNRGGSMGDVEGAAPTVVLDYQKAAPTGPNDVLKLRVFVDAFGTHIAFRRTADDNNADVLQELNSVPFVTTQMMASGLKDPLDPEGRLAMMGWAGRPNAFNYFHQPNPAFRPYVVNPFDNQNRGPYCVSAGRNKRHNDVGLDDLYSFRLQQSGKGN